jgi:hypothetical protein
MIILISKASISRPTSSSPPQPPYIIRYAFQLRSGKRTIGRCIISVTNDQNWMNSGHPGHDWLWVRQVPLLALGRHRSAQSLPYKGLRGRLPAQALFLISLNIGTTGEPIPSAPVVMTEPLNNGIAENASAMPSVAFPASVDKQLAVIHAGSVDSAAHVVPLVPDERKNTRFIVNAHIDLQT